MKKLKLGILGPSEIAARRFLPALGDNMTLVGLAVSDREEWAGEISEEAFCTLNSKEREKASRILDQYGGRLFESYTDLIENPDVDAVYIPLPPALHFCWGGAALKSGKHVLLEKPLTVSLMDTEELVALAKEKHLLVYENYAFEFHKQIDMIREIVASGLLGEIRQIRATFGFPYRGAKDFRYNNALGGGAVNDCGGYPIKLSTVLLGDTIKVVYSNLGLSREHDVDTYGTAVFTNDRGTVSVASFGMDNTYKCELEIWGSKNSLLAPRVFTPPADYEAKLIISGEEQTEIIIEKDDYFRNSIKRFVDRVYGDRESVYREILLQNRLMELVRGRVAK